MAFIHTIIFSLFLSTAFSQRLRFYAAAQGGGISNWKPSKYVKSPVFTVCPDTLPPQFTLVCIPPKPVAYAEFQIGNKFKRTERVTPYTIASDFDGIAHPWNPPSSVKVKCKLSNGEQISTTIHFVCNGVPVTRPPTTKPPATIESPSKPRFQSFAGSTGSGSSSGSTEDCVKIPAMRPDSLYKSPRADSGWERHRGALWYRPRDGHRGTTSSGRVVATYKFKAPASGRFGFTLDMETHGHVDHNDVWVLFEPNGFILIKGGSSRSSRGWTKAYHNKNGRSTQVWSVDHNPHSFATNEKLVKGREYTVKVGGRSTKTGFYSIIMFPCSGSQCVVTSSYWTNMRKNCA